MKQKNIGIIMLSVGIVLTAIGFYWVNTQDRDTESTVPVVATSNDEPARTSNNEQSNIQKGQAFEEYVISKFDFSRRSLTLLSRANNNTRASIPDLDIKLTAGGKEYRFAAECVWRQNMPQESLDWCKEEKIELLKNYETTNNAKVFIIAGIGGTPNLPVQLYIIPLDERPYANIYTSVLAKYEVTTLEGKFFYETSTNRLTIK